MSAPFRVRIIQPCIGRRRGQRGYIRTWQMEPLAVALLAGLLPADVEVGFSDDRFGESAAEAPCDLALIPVETYTARRAYQIASDLRRRRVPVVMGGFHATLAPDEVMRYADSTVVGEAEEVLPRLIDDWRHGRSQHVYRASGRPSLTARRYRRDVYAGRSYLPISLVETSRGCRHTCDFCAVTAAYAASTKRRPADEVAAEVATLPRHRLIFLIDDNFVADPAGAKELCRALAPLRRRWVGQATVAAARDPELLSLMAASGCRGVLVGFESLDQAELERMGKGFNRNPAAAIAAFRSHGIAVYGTFVIGSDGDDAASVAERLRFALDQGLFLAGFNHCTPFPGTPLHHRLAAEGRLRWPAWWLADDYRYNEVPYHPQRMSAAEVREACLAARRRFYGVGGIWRRLRLGERLRDPRMAALFLAANAMHRGDVDGRDGLPLGDEAWNGELIPV